MSETHTKGNVIVEDIKVGDIHYEFEKGLYTKCQVMTLPKKNENNQWEWQSKHLLTEVIIDYLVNPEYTQYSANLYDYMAYTGFIEV